MSIWTIRDLAPAERPRERLQTLGAAALADTELVAVLLRTGTAGLSVLELARALLSDFGGLSGLQRANAVALRRRGLGEAKAAALLAALELARRLARASLPERTPLTKPREVADYLALRYCRSAQEVMGALYLDGRHRLVGECELFRGALGRISVEPRAILKEALLRDASALILFHTHPSGDPSPSTEDLLFTRSFVEASSLLGIELADHLIVGGPGRWVSLKAQGW